MVAVKRGVNGDDFFNGALFIRLKLNLESLGDRAGCGFNAFFRGDRRTRHADSCPGVGDDVVLRCLGAHMQHDAVFIAPAVDLFKMIG